MQFWSGTAFMDPLEAVPVARMLDEAGYDGILCPSRSTSVALTERPRNATPLEPAAKPALKAWLSDPLLSAVMPRMMSERLVLPLRSMSSRVITCTGAGVSVSRRRICEPVTTTRSSWELAASPGSAACE